MAYRLYRDEDWIGFWAERPAIWEILQKHYIKGRGLRIVEYYIK